MLKTILRMWVLYSATTAALLGTVVQLVWDPSPSATNRFVEYVIALDRSPAVLTNNVRNAHTLLMVGTNTSVVVVNKFEDPPWYAVAYAVSSNLWSEPSNMVEIHPPAPVTNLMRAALDVSPDLEMWTNAGFIRLRLTR